jgi:tetratricopeptide (TPR) repeat protein
MALDFLRHRRLPISLTAEKRESLGFLANFLQLDALTAYLEMLESHSRAQTEPGLLHHLTAADACFDCNEEELAFQHWHSSYAHLTTHDAETARSAHYAQAIVEQPDCPWRLFQHGINLQPLSPAAIEATAALQALAPQSAMSLYLEAHSFFALPCPGSDQRGSDRGNLDELCKRALEREPRLFLAHILRYRAGPDTTNKCVALQETLHGFAAPLAGCKEMQLAAAEELLEAKNLSAAHAKYTEILRHFPKLAPAHFGLAATLRLQGNLAGALEAIEKSPTTGSIDPHVHVLYGQILTDLRRFPEALEALKAYTEKEKTRWPVPNSQICEWELYLQTDDAAYAIATAHLGLRQYPEALAALADQLDNGEIDGALLAARAQVGMQRFELAEVALNYCIESCRDPVLPQLIEALKCRLHLFIQTGQFSKALADVEEAIGLGSPTLIMCNVRLRLMQDLQVPAAVLEAARAEARQFFPGIR